MVRYLCVHHGGTGIRPIHLLGAPPSGDTSDLQIKQWEKPEPIVPMYRR